MMRRWGAAALRADDLKEILSGHGVPDIKCTKPLALHFKALTGDAARAVADAWWDYLDSKSPAEAKSRLALLDEAARIYNMTVEMLMSFEEVSIFDEVGL